MEKVDPIREKLEYEKEQLVKKLLEKQVKGDIVKGLIIPVGSLIVALLGVLSGVYAQYIGSQATIQAATISTQQTGYAKIITALDSALYAKQENRLQAIHLDNFRQAYYELELLIPAEMREPILEELEQLVAFLLIDEKVTDEFVVQFTDARRSFRYHLQKALERNGI